MTNVSLNLMVEVLNIQYKNVWFDRVFDFGLISKNYLEIIDGVLRQRELFYYLYMWLVAVHMQNIFLYYNLG